MLKSILKMSTPISSTSIDAIVMCIMQRMGALELHVLTPVPYSYVSVHCEGYFVSEDHYLIRLVRVMGCG